MANRKHNIRKRLRGMMTGVVLSYDGNNDNRLQYRNRYGLPITKEQLDVAMNWAWRWEITIGVKLRLGDTVRLVEEPLPVDQQCRINELTDLVQEKTLILALSQPSAWNVEKHVWSAKILG